MKKILKYLLLSFFFILTWLIISPNFGGSRTTEAIYMENSELDAKIDDDSILRAQDHTNSEDNTILHDLKPGDKLSIVLTTTIKGPRNYSDSDFIEQTTILLPKIDVGNYDLSNPQIATLFTRTNLGFKRTCGRNVRQGSLSISKIEDSKIFGKIDFTVECIKYNKHGKTYSYQEKFTAKKVEPPRQ